MEEDLYERYKGYSKEQIFDILEDPGEYQEDAMKAATKVLWKNGWNEEFQEMLLFKEQQSVEETEEKAAYLKKASEFHNGNFFFDINSSDVMKFEAALDKEGIDFFKEENKKTTVQFDTNPTEKYYFKKEDVPSVDRICAQLEIAVKPYLSHNKFFNMQIKVITVIIIILLVLVFYVFN
ncbi:MAG: hypothetical protein V2A54_02755 [Bacteroidota bacterium]